MKPSPSSKDRNTRKTKHKRCPQILAATETNELVHKLDKSPATISALQQGTPLKYKTNWLIPEEKKPQVERNKVSGCTNQSDLPYCMEPVASQISIPCSKCQALGQLVQLQGILKGRSSGQVVPAPAGTAPTVSHRPDFSLCPNPFSSLPFFVY